MSTIDPGRVADSVTAGNDPTGPGWFGAGYGDGLYDNWPQVQAEFGARAVLDIAVNPAHDIGNCLDIEWGDANPADAPGWTARARARHVSPVWDYTGLDEWPSVIQAFLDQATPMPDRWWVAHYTWIPHLPQTFVHGVWYTADACQYAGGVGARYDTSCFRPGAFDANQPTPPPASEDPVIPISGLPHGKLNAPIVAARPRPNHPGQGWRFGADGGVFPWGGAPVFGNPSNVKLAAPVIDAVVAENGYTMIGSDGGDFTYGPEAPPVGSLA